MKLWDKNNDQATDSVIESFTVGNDNVLDEKYFLVYDIKATIAHASALKRAGIYSESEYNKVAYVLHRLESKASRGLIQVPVSDEDGHTTIERLLTDELGDLGKKIHTGRSRNDQALTMIRLFMQRSLHDVTNRVDEVYVALSILANKYRDQLFIGYTHGQQAMPITLGHYFDSYRDQLLNDIRYVHSVRKSINTNPLGSGAGFGSSVNIDRMHTTLKLDFDGTQVNSLYCQNSRGQYELRYLHALSQFMFTAQKLATDLIMYTSREFDFFSVSPEVTTGSSMMPQKQNLDVAELIRANHAVVTSCEARVSTLCHGLMSGYNRDYQLIKQSLVEAHEATYNCYAALKKLMYAITPKSESIKAKLKADIFATDLALEKATLENTPFRTAYKEALEDVEHIARIPESDMVKIVKNRKTLGAPGNY